jgi:hypothetical protein
MKNKHFATGLFMAAACMTTVASARDEGPRFAQDRLDALVAHHAEASRHIARAQHGALPPSQQVPQSPKEAGRAS